MNEIHYLTRLRHSEPKLVIEAAQATHRRGLPVRLVRLAPDLPDAVQHLTRNAVVPHHRFPVPEAAEFPLDHEGPDAVGCPVQQGMATMLPVRFVRLHIEGSQCRESLLDLVAQGVGWCCQRGSNSGSRQINSWKHKAF